MTTEDLLKLVSPSPMASENLVHGAVRGLRRTLNDADLIRNERSKGLCVYRQRHAEGARQIARIRLHQLRRRLSDRKSKHDGHQDAMHLSSLP